MIDYITHLLRDYPALTVFLTVGLGFLLGRVRFGNFQLGSVTSVLIIGVVIGQLDIPMSGIMKTFFFMMFLFSIGYSVGPDFFRSLKGDGAKQALFAVCMSAVCCLVTIGFALWMGYTKGETVGLFGGSQTCSSIIGLGGEAIAKLPLPEEVIKQQTDIIPVCYAVTYIFGTLGTVILLGNLGPKFLGGIDRVREQTERLEEKLKGGVGSSDPAVVNALKHVTYRAYRLADGWFEEPRTVYEAESFLRAQGLVVFVDHVMHDGRVYVPGYDDTLYPGDTVVCCGVTKYMIQLPTYLGPEQPDSPALTYPVERIPVRVSKSGFIGKTLHTLRSRKYMRGVVIRDTVRAGSALQTDGNTVFEKGDVITLVGRKEWLEDAVPHIGTADRPSVASDLMFVGLAIFIGGLLGALNFWVGGIPVSLGTSGGALIAGLFFGWLRSKRPTYGHISPGALWIMNNLGLNVFIAVVGIQAAPSFISGIREIGPMLFVVGAAATTIPVCFGLWLGHKVFKFPAALTLGCTAGTRTCTAALGAVQNALGSSLPAIGYAVTYAVSNILLIIWGMVAVAVIP